MIKILALAIFLSAGPSANVAAQTDVQAEGPSPEEVRRSLNSRRSYTLSEKFFEEITAVQDLIETSELEPAEAQIALLREAKSRNPYEIALLFQTEAAVHIERDRYDLAAAALEASLATGGLPKASHIGVLMNIGQLYLVLDRHTKALEYLELWDSLSTLQDPFGKMMLASAYAETGRADIAIATAEDAIAMAQEPQEAWFEFLMGQYYKLENFENAERVLSELVVRFPDTERHWTTLGSVYVELEQPKAALAVLEDAYAHGRMTQDFAIRTLAGLYLREDIPFKAAVLLDRELKNGRLEPDVNTMRLVASAWIEAREVNRALPPLKDAAEKAEDGELSYFLGQKLYEMEDWAAAANALQSALQKGKLASEGHVHLLLGLAYLQDDRLERSARAFRAATRHDAVKTDAENWLTFIESQQEGQG